MENMSNKSNFEEFTNLYELSKTLRFELIPDPKTREKMNENLLYDETLKTFLKDQDIEDAYQILKPVFDKIHEDFIIKSLENEEAKKIDFYNYYQLKSELLKIDKKSKEKEYTNKKKEIENEEKTLRKKIVELYKVTWDYYINLAGKSDNEKPILKEKGFKVLTENWILKYIKSNIDYFSSLKLTTREEISQKKWNKNLVEKSDLEKAIGTTEKKWVFEWFFTYFWGFNQNRENYYSDEDKSTSVSNRIINENLPKFVDNIFLYEKQKIEYQNIFNELKNANKILKIKDKEWKEKEVTEFYNNIFNINYFKNCLSQKEIDEYNNKIWDNNYLINLYNQLNWKKDWFKKLPQFKILFKQIGCWEKHDFIISIKNDNDLIETLIKVKNAGKKYFQDNAENRTINDFIHVLETLEDYKWIYWNKQAINTISSKYFANWHELEDKLVVNKIFKEDKKSDEKIKIPDAIELSDLFDVLDSFNNENWKKEWWIFFKNSIFDIKIDEKIKNYKWDEGWEKDWKQRLLYIKRKTDIIKDSKLPSKALLSMVLDDLKDSAEKFLKNTDVIESEIVKIIVFKNDEEKSKIKLWIDETIGINRILKYFVTKENKRKWSPQNSYVENILKSLFEFDWFGCYDNVRNYLTKKPQSEINKLKLNFENSTLWSWWDVNQESKNLCVILQDEKKWQYLAILNNQNKNIFQKELTDWRWKNKIIMENPIYDETWKWEKVDYKQIAAPTWIWGFVRKCFNSAQEYWWYCPINCLNNEWKIIIKNDEVNWNLKELIDCYKDFFNKYEKDGFQYKNYNFKFKNSEQYGNLNEFFQDVENQGYKISFTNISEIEIKKLVNEWKIYLFKIKNKDYSKKQDENHKNNLHTIYWRAIFWDNENKPKLNWWAEIFFRPVWIEKIAKKWYESKIDKNTWEDYIIENKRYTEEKFLFHCPIKINYKSKSYSKPLFAINEVNKKINEQITKPENISSICFLWIDRWEKHLAYYSLVNLKWDIVKNKDWKYIQGSLNKINWQDYNAKLEELSKNRDEARKNWQTIWTIKEMKNGYISQVVHEIVKLAIENNALIVLENLNTGFKRWRQKIEKQVYQKLELALAKKLNFVVDKKAKDWEIMSVQNALQLTPPVNNFWDIENSKQYWIMLYTRANYTSQTDPKTWWRKSIYLKKWSEKNIKDQICEIFYDFGFDGKDYYFSYTDRNTAKEWILYSGLNGTSLDRFRWKKNDHDNWIIEKIDIVKILDWIFENFDKSKSLKNQILQEWKELKKVWEFTAWESLRYAIEMIQQIRNSWPKDKDWNPTCDDDFIFSPVRENGKHFDSREFLAQDLPEMPNSWDSNGAYNIARKWIIQFEHIKRNLEQYISDNEYDNFLAWKDKWEKYLENHKKDLTKKWK